MTDPNRESLPALAGQRAEDEQNRDRERAADKQNRDRERAADKQNRDRQRAADKQNRDRQRAETGAPPTEEPLSDGRGSDQRRGTEQPLSDGRGTAPRGADGAGVPLAYFITFRAYATWLHGDARGSVDRAHNTPNTPLLPPDSARESHERALSRSSPVVLDADRRQVVEATILDVCRHNDWSIHELNVRTNHIHLVVSAPEQPEQVMRSFKSWCTRRLREAGLIGSKDAVWSRHGSTQYLWKQDSVEEACGYVRDAQGEDL